MNTDTVNTLASIFERAKQAALEADPGPDKDGGTCNFDTPAFRIDGMRKPTIEAAAKTAGITVTQFDWFGGRKWYWLNVPMMGQGNRRSWMMEAAQNVLNDAKQSFPGFHACGYYQMD